MKEFRSAVSFDIETAKLAPRRDDDEVEFNPGGAWAIGVNCAATVKTYDSKNQVKTWWSGQGALPGMSGDAPGKMDHESLRGLLYYLGECLLDGFTPFTWNGATFDFRVIASEAPSLARACKFLSLNHVDGFFQIYGLTGNFVRLDAALRGMGFEGKSVAGMSGKDAPKEWKKDYQKVLDYVTEDVWQPLQFFHRVLEFGYMNWAAKGNYSVNTDIKNLRRTKGRGNARINGWYTVHDCLAGLPWPDPFPPSLPGPRDMLKWLDGIPPLNEDDIGILPEELVRAVIGGS